MTHESLSPESRNDQENNRLNRRTFLSGLTAAALAGVAWPHELLEAASHGSNSDKFGELLPTRALGRTGERVTLLGFGGNHFRRLPEDQQEPAIEKAIAGGIRFFDTANAYGTDQLGERLYGKYLIPKYRDSIFLMTKSMAKDPKLVREHLEWSLRNMKTDQLDLWQIHSITSVEDAHSRWDDGVVDVFLKAQEEGKVRMIGFSGHHDFRAHREMLNLFKQRGVPLQTIQMPVNVADASYDSFIEEVIPLAQEMGVGILAMKTMCGGRLFGGIGAGWGDHGKIPAEPIIPDLLKFRDATDYVWSMPIATRIAGFDNLDQLQEHIDAARQLRTLTPQQQSTIIKAAAHRSGPIMEFYKRDTLA